MISKVWVVHPVRDDISAAGEFGDLHFVNDGYVYGDQMRDDGRLPQNVTDRLDTMVQKFDRDNDYLLTVGDHLQLLYATAALAVRFRGHEGRLFRVLRYDRVAKGYWVGVIG